MPTWAPQSRRYRDGTHRPHPHPSRKTQYHPFESIAKPLIPNNPIISPLLETEVGQSPPNLNLTIPNNPDPALLKIMPSPTP
ncbi:hypothetical protein BGS_0071 [Beggiatoa sp. SS]|nr:hypothetical protein BGS_0071 [Beggiatoa sp. SS]